MLPVSSFLKDQSSATDLELQQGRIGGCFRNYDIHGDTLGVRCEDKELDEVR
jgi:hypothetical protein